MLQLVAGMDDGPLWFECVDVLLARRLASVRAVRMERVFQGFDTGVGTTDRAGELRSGDGFDESSDPLVETQMKGQALVSILSGVGGSSHCGSEARGLTPRAEVAHTGDLTRTPVSK